MGSDTNPQLRAMLPFKAFSGTAGYILSEAQPLEKTRFIIRMGYLF